MSRHTASRVVACTTLPVDLLNEWVVNVEGVRRTRYVGPDAPYRAANAANDWRRKLGEAPSVHGEAVA